MAFLPFFGGSCPPRYFSSFPNVKTIWLIQNDQKNHYAFEKQQSEGKMANTLRAITSDCVNFCKIEKSNLFIHFGPKSTHISGCKIVHLCTIATVRAYIHGYCSTSIYYFIFSLSSIIWLSLLSHLISLFLCLLNPFIFP